MYQVEEPLETVHLYVVREEQPRPFFLLPFVFALLCVGVMVGVTVSSGMYPSYLHQTLTLPAHLFTREYHITEPIMPTGTKTSPATYATGLLTFYNGSIVVQQLPAGTVIVGTDGAQVMTNALVVVPAGNPPLYGVATVSAHALSPGSQGNIVPFTLNQVYGTSLYIRNAHPFTGGRNASSVQMVTKEDRQRALAAARATLTPQKAKVEAFLAFPCKETAHFENLVVGLFMSCQYVSYTVPSHMHVTHVRLVGNNLLVDVVFVPPPQRIVVK